MCIRDIFLAVYYGLSAVYMLKFRKSCCFRADFSYSMDIP